LKDYELKLTWLKKLTTSMRMKELSSISFAVRPAEPV
jgi:hypothetical protein